MIDRQTKRSIGQRVRVTTPSGHDEPGTIVARHRTKSGLVYKVQLDKYCPYLVSGDYLTDIEYSPGPVPLA
jgi:hypothetical protein